MHVSLMTGGLDIYIRNSIEYASGMHNYVIVHGKKEIVTPIHCKGEQIPTYAIDLQRNPSLWKDLKAIYQVIRLIRELHPDVIHCHSAKGGIIGRIAGYLTGTPTLYTAHAFSFLSTRHRSLRTFYRVTERMTRLKASLLACSESEQTLGIKYVHYPKDRALVWHNVTPRPEIDESRMKVDIPEGPYLCTIGRPSYQKNPFFLLDMFTEIHKQHPELKLYLVGAGFHSPLLSKINERVKKMGLEDLFVILPWISHHDAMALVKHSLFYVTVSRYEGLPLSVIESLSIGKCVVASDVIGNRDCVQHQVNGLLIETKNPKASAQQVCNLIDHPDEIEKMSRESLRVYQERFNIEDRITILENIYVQYANK